MNTRAFGAAGLLALAFCTPSLAQERAGLYVGGNFGFTRSDSGTFERDVRNDLLASGFSTADVSADESDTGFKLIVGYQVNPNVALEAYYANLGKYSFRVNTTGPTVTGGGDFEITGFGLDVLAMLPFNRSVSGFARVGFFRWDVEGRVFATGPGGSASDSLEDDGSDVKFGLGVQWALSPNLSIRGEFEYYNFDDKLMMLSAGVLYRF